MERKSLPCCSSCYPFREYKESAVCSQCCQSVLCDGKVCTSQSSMQINDADTGLKDWVYSGRPRFDPRHLVPGAPQAWCLSLLICSRAKPVWPPDKSKHKKEGEDLFCLRCFSHLYGMSLSVLSKGCQLALHVSSAWQMLNKYKFLLFSFFLKRSPIVCGLSWVVRDWRKEVIQVNWCWHYHVYCFTCPHTWYCQRHVRVIQCK